MNRLIGLLLLVLSVGAEAAETGLPLASAKVDVFDVASLERGAGYYVNYCLSCHSLKHLRYSRLAQDLQLQADAMPKALMVPGFKIHDSLLSALSSADAEQWFGVAPPDLSLIARSRGADWLYSYLKGFYLDPTRPTGVNNAVFSEVGMPNVLWALQGQQRPVYQDEDGQRLIKRLESVQAGSMSAPEFDQAMTDLVNFLVYAGEPAQFQRLRLGKYVLFGLILLAVLLYKLKKAYWQDID